MTYSGRPGASPVVAGLVLAGVIKKSDAVLDVGSLDGTDCLALAAWGIQRVVGVEKDHAMANTAQRKLRGRIGRYGRRRFCLDHVELYSGTMTREHPCLKDRSFDVVIDTLVWSGLKSPEMPGYFRQVARVLRPGGLFVLHARIPGCPEFDVKPRTDLPSSLRQWFRMTDGYITHLADFRNKKRDHADIAVYLGRRRARRVPPTALRFARWETPRRA